MARAIYLSGLIGAATLRGCGPSAAADGPSSGDAASSGTAAPTTSAAPGTTREPEPGSSTGTVDGTSSGASPTTTTGADTGEVCAPPTCAGTRYTCVDGEDNDGDGLVDLDDPQCLGPCDDTEDELDPSLPSDAGDCRFDCFFDSNTGQGDDGCSYDLRCDPADPGAAIGCEFSGGLECDQPPFPPPQDAECIAFCEPYVPPGCDCFGCCEIQTDAGPVFILLETADETCTFDTPELCPSCTSQIEQCGNPCEGCEVCLGQTAPPAGCEVQECDVGEPCQSHCDCPDGGYCAGGCCYPPPPG